jgi:cytochrome b
VEKLDSSQRFKTAAEPFAQTFRMSAAGSLRSWILVWNLPARVCHWGFSVTMLGALWLGYDADPEGNLFKAHMLCGILACWFLLVRILLGFFGGRYLRWSGLFFGVRATLAYLLDVLAWRIADFTGLNPGSAAFALAIYTATPVLVWTGFVLELAESWHGWLSLGAAVLIAVHLLGLLLHALRHREATPLAMIHGKVRGIERDTLPDHSALTGIVLAVISLALGCLLFLCFDFGSATLELPFLPEFGFPAMQKG